MPPTENMCPCHTLPNFVAIHLKHAQELWCTKLRADANTSHTLTLTQTHTHLRKLNLLLISLTQISHILCDWEVLYTHSAVHSQRHSYTTQIYVPCPISTARQGEWCLSLWRNNIITHCPILKLEPQCVNGCQTLFQESSKGAITDPPWEGKANLAGRTT